MDCSRSRLASRTSGHARAGQGLRVADATIPATTGAGPSRRGGELAVRASIDDFPWYPVHRAAFACLLLDLGRDAEARIGLRGLRAMIDFRALLSRQRMAPRGRRWPAKRASLLGRCDGGRDRCTTQLDPFAGRHAIGHKEGSVGAVDRYLGLLASHPRPGSMTPIRHLDGRHRGQRAHGERGRGRRIAGTTWPRFCRGRDAAGDRARARRHWTRSALATARRLGMALADADQLPHAVVGDVGPRALGRQPAPVRVRRRSFSREGEYWTIEFGSDLIRDPRRPRDGHLARLLSAPGPWRYTLVELS